LTDYSKKLAKRWKATNARYPQLRAISIDSTANVVELRGVRKLDVQFHHPVTFLAGRNGSGKSTCAYKFHRGGAPL
jgi:recombinational DNA repair ATPase RecF